MAEEKRIKKIKLSNGDVYSIFDQGALRLGVDPSDPTGSNKILLTGNTVVDEVILKGHLRITAVDDVPLETSINNVLVQDTSTGEIKKRSTDQLLEDIGGISYSMDDDTSTLSLKFGRQTT